MQNKVNTRHQNFKKELRKYHDVINKRNHYNLAKIAGKLDLFESDNDDESYEKDRRVPNTDILVMKKGMLYALADLDGKLLTDFKYQFIEGCLGEHNKIIRCITDDGDIENFSVERHEIINNDIKNVIDTAANESVGMGVASVGVSDTGAVGATSGDTTTNGIKHEINYDDVYEDLKLPYFCCYRIKDVNKRINKKYGKPRRKKRTK